MNHSLIKTIGFSGNDVNCCAFGSSMLFAACSSEKNARLYDSADFTEIDGSPLATVHRYPISACSFHPSAPLLLTTAIDGFVVVWDVEDPTSSKQIMHLKLEASFKSGLFSPCGQFIALGDTEGQVTLISMSSGTVLRKYVGLVGQLTALAFTPDSLYILAGSSGMSSGDLVLWPVKHTLEELNLAHSISHISCAHEMGTYSLCFSFSFDSGEEDSHFLCASGGGDCFVKLWSIRPNASTLERINLRSTLKYHTYSITFCAFAHSCNLLASSSLDKKVIIWNALHATMLHCIDNHTRYVATIAWHPERNLTLATGGNDKLINIWQLQMLENNNITTVKQASSGLFRPVKYLLNWTVRDVSNWLRQIKLEKYVETFKSNNVDGKVLKNLTEEKIINYLHIDSLGHRETIITAISTILKSENLSDDVPNEFICPISQELMKDPHIALDGFTYENEAITQWLSKSKLSPVTNLPLMSAQLIPNRALKALIERHVDMCSLSK